MLRIAASLALPLLLSACSGPAAEAPGVARVAEDTVRPLAAHRLSPDSVRARERSPWVEQTLRSLSLREKAAQLVVGWMGGGTLTPGTEEYTRLRRWVREERIGGLILSIGTPQAYMGRINALQDGARIPLLVMTDMESGPGMRLVTGSGRRGGTSIPPVMALGAAGSDSLAAAVGRVIGEEGRAAGVTLNLAPTLDVNSDPSNPIINTRSFSEDPQLVARLGTAYLRGMQEGGLLTTGKHFPGHGDTNTDSHIALATVDASRERLEEVELAPFRAAVNAGVDAILVGHIAVPALTDERPVPPASLSPAVVTGLLREEMGFRGLVITDALNMGGVTRRYSQAESVVRAVEAGADLLLQPPEPGAAVDALVRAVETGRLTEDRVDQSVRRILAAKERAGLSDPAAALVRPAEMERVVGSPEHARVAQEVARRSLVLARDRGNLVPLKPDVRRVLSITYTDVASSGAGRVFDRVLEQSGLAVSSARVTGNTPAATLSALAARAEQADVVIVSAYVQPREYRGTVEASGGISTLVERLAAGGKPVIAVSFGSPYVVRAFPSVPAYLLAWGSIGISQDAAAQALLGNIPITGTLPVTIPPDLPRGTGIQRRARAGGSQ